MTAKKKAPAKKAPAKPEPPKPPELLMAHFDPATFTIVATYRHVAGNFKLAITPAELGKFLATIPWSVLPDGDDDADETIDVFRAASEALESIQP